MNWDDVWSILRWVIVVFAAGFIGYFGKYLAKKLIPSTKAEEISKESPERTVIKEKNDYKREKKRLKSEQKIRKKKK